MLANRDEFEWQERIDGPNFGSLATHISHVPFYVRCKYHHFPVAHGRYHPITYGTNHMLPTNQLYAAHRDEGALSLGVIYDCSLEVGNPQNFGGGSCVTPQEMYDRRRMRVMFPYPDVHASRPAEPSPPSDTSSATAAHRAGQEMDDSAGSNDDLLYDTVDEETRHDEEQIVRPPPRWFVGRHTRNWLENPTGESNQHTFNWLGNPTPR